MSRNDDIFDFSEINLKDLGKVGGKNASLGELYNSLKNLGVNVLDGFATTANAFRQFLKEENLEERFRSDLSDFDPKDTPELQSRGIAASRAILKASLPADLRAAILVRYDRLCANFGHETELAVRSSATAEDLPEASFAGAAEAF